MRSFRTLQISGNLPSLYYLTESFYPPFVGGLEKHAHQLSRKLAELGLGVTVVTRKIVPESPADEYFGKVSVKRIPPHGILKGKGWKSVFPVLFLMIVISIIMVLDLGSYDLLLVSGLRVLAVPAVLGSLVLGKRCIIKVESPIELREDISSESLRRMKIPQSFFIFKILRGIRNAVIKRADCFVAISTEIQNQLVDIGVDRTKIQLIPNGVDVEKFRPVSNSDKSALRRVLSLPPDQLIFIFTGRVAVSKGLLLLIEVWQELAEKNPDIHLIVVGSGQRSFDGCESQLIDFIKLHYLEPSVTLMGEVDNVHEYLQAADVFVFPSEYEGFSLSLVEAMACGLPSLVTRVGAAEQLIENRKNGILISPREKQELKAAFEWLLENRASWATMGVDARQAVVVKYSMDAVAKAYYDLIVGLCYKENQITHQKPAEQEASGKAV